MIEPLLHFGGGGPPRSWPVPWPGKNEELAANLLEADDALVRGGYCGPDDRGAYFHTVLCLLWPNAESRIFEGRMAGQFIPLIRLRISSRGFLPGFGSCFMPEGKDDVIDRLGGVVAWRGDQQQAIALLAQVLRAP